MSLLMIPGMAHRDLFGDFTWTQFGLYVICAASVWLLHLRLVKCVFQKIEDRRLQTQDGSSHGTKNANNQSLDRSGRSGGNQVEG
jgi:hypothetical protein